MPSPVPDPLARARLNAPKPRRRGLPTAYIWLAVAAGGLLLLIVALVVGGSGGDQAKRNGRKKATQTGKAKPKREPVGSPWGEGRSMAPPGSRNLGDLLKAPDDPAGETKSVSSQLAAARAAMARRDLPAARQAVAAARPLAQSPAEKQEWERVETLLKSLDAFWKAVADESGRLRSGQELEFGSERVMIVETRPDLLTVRAQGKIRLYAPQDLPPAFAVLLAERGLKNFDPNVDLHVGSFHAIDAQGDRAAARQRWQRAGDLGKLLLGELEAGTGKQ